MDGKDIVKIIDDELSKRGMTQKEFCAELGIQSSAMSMWRKGSMPKPERLKQIEKYLNINLSDIEKSDPREELRDDLRILLNSASDLPPSSVYAMISQIEKMKEDAT